MRFLILVALNELDLLGPNPIKYLQIVKKYNLVYNFLLKHRFIKKFKTIRSFHHFMYLIFCKIELFFLKV